jgi:hypothetical protein
VLDFFAEGVQTSAAQAVVTAQALLSLVNQDRDRIVKLGRPAASALALHEVLQHEPPAPSTALMFRAYPSRKRQVSENGLGGRSIGHPLRKQTTSASRALALNDALSQRCRARGCGFALYRQPPPVVHLDDCQTFFRILARHSCHEARVGPGISVMHTFFPITGRPRFRLLSRCHSESLDPKLAAAQRRRDETSAQPVERRFVLATIPALTNVPELCRSTRVSGPTECAWSIRPRAAAIAPEPLLVPFQPAEVGIGRCDQATQRGKGAWTIRLERR